MTAAAKQPQLNRVVDVVCGMGDFTGPFAGFLVGDIKLSLEAVLDIPYFSEPFVNGRPVTLDYKLDVGDHLQFVKCFGAKGAKDRPENEAQGEAFLKAYGDDLRRDLLETVNITVETGLASLKMWL